jgi:simple sugar transport system permease protein
MSDAAEPDPDGGPDTAVVAPPRPEPGLEEPPAAGRRAVELWNNVVLTVLAIVLALLLGAVLIIFSDETVTDTLSSFFSNPGDFFSAAWESVSTSYKALFQGAFINFDATTVSEALRPLSETLLNATPLIAGGLAVALAFRAGLFNIGVEGQIILGAIFAGYVGFTWHLPVIVHVVVAIVAAVVGGALWAGIAGFLKARTGAHEVITTIMLNWIARFLLAYLLTTTAFQRPGRTDPISPNVDENAELPRLLSDYRVHWGLVVMLAAALFVWWLLNRSTIGFRFRAVGANPAAARAAGIRVNREIVSVMLIAGALAGLAGASQVLGTLKNLTGGVSAGIGFDSITVALLGRGSPLGVILASILFGGLRAGGVAMQAQTGTPIDIVLILQALIVLFIAAPPLVRKIFRIRAAGRVGTMQVSKGWSA